MHHSVLGLSCQHLHDRFLLLCLLSEYWHQPEGINRKLAHMQTHSPAAVHIPSSTGMEELFAVSSARRAGSGMLKSGRKWNFGERVVIKDSLLTRRETSLALGEMI